MMNWAASPWASTLHHGGGYALMSEGRRRPPARSSRVTRVAFTANTSHITPTLKPNHIPILRSLNVNQAYINPNNGPLLKRKWSIVETKMVHC